MFKRLYGETEEQQLQYLYPKVRITAIGALIMIGSMILGYLLKLDALGAVAGIAYVFLIFYWGWPTVKAWFGVATVGALFSRNIVFGAVIFCCYMLLSIIAGVIFLFLGIGRYIYLKQMSRKGA